MNAAPKTLRHLSELEAAGLAPQVRDAVDLGARRDIEAEVIAGCGLALWSVWQLERDDHEVRILARVRQPGAGVVA